jgi:hypothetical protein
MLSDEPESAVDRASALGTAAAEEAGDRFRSNSISFVLRGVVIAIQSDNVQNRRWQSMHVKGNP